MKLPIPQDWDGETWCRWSICWPQSEGWEGILRGFITLPQRGWTWDERIGSILAVQETGRQITAENIPLNGVFMACNDTELVSAFNDIALALRYLADRQFAKPCCGGGAPGTVGEGSGGAGPSQPPFNPSTPGNPDVDPPPDGFDSWEDFFTQKCAVAINIVETLEDDLGELAVRTLIGISVEAVAAIIVIAISTPVPFDDILVIAGLLLSVAAEIVLTSALNIVNENEHELICALYNGTNSQSSRSMFLDAFGSLVDGSGIDPVEGFAIKTVMAYFVGASVTNRLYVKDLTRTWSGGDCSDCVPCCFEFQIGLQGWSVVAVGPNFEHPVTGSVSHVAGSMRLDLAQSGESEYAGARSPLLDCDLAEGAALCVNVSDSSAGSFNNYISVVIDDVEINVAALTGTATGVSNYDLSAYAGQTLQRIFLGFSRAAAGTFVKVTRVGICDPCEQ